MIDMIVPSTNRELDDVHRLMRDFVSWHMERHSQDTELINKYFDRCEFEEELSNLPGIYGGPEGALLLAYFGGKAAGCVALKRLDEKTCEMKRMYVDSKVQGKGVGRALGAGIVEKAKEAGYSKMYLDNKHQSDRSNDFVSVNGFHRCRPILRCTKRAARMAHIYEVRSMRTEKAQQGRGSPTLDRSLPSLPLRSVAVKRV